MSGRNKRKSETPTEAYCRDPEAYMRQLMAADAWSADELKPALDLPTSDRLARLVEKGPKGVKATAWLYDEKGRFVCRYWCQEDVDHDSKSYLEEGRKVEFRPDPRPERYVHDVRHFLDCHAISPPTSSSESDEPAPKKNEKKKTKTKRNWRRWP